jgi:TldD protein
MMFTETINHAFSRFGVSEELIKRTLQAALNFGGDYADLFFEHSFANSLSLQDGEVNRVASNIDFGVGVRVIVGEQTGYAYVENITDHELLNAARTAAHIAHNSSKKVTIANITENQQPYNYYIVNNPWETTAVSFKIPFIQRINEKLFAADNRVVKATVTCNDADSHILFCNSEGLLCYDRRPMATLAAQCVMNHKGRTESNSAARSQRMDANFLNDSLTDSLVHELISKTAILFEAVKPKGGEMPVVMGAGGSGILLHEAIGHAFEADFNRKNTSIFADKLGQRICNSDINIIDDGTIPFNRGAVNFDDEGVAGQKTYIVQHGILTSYLHDRISALHYGVKPTGNGRRESFRTPPLPRMRATCMEAGTFLPQELIETVKNGVFVSGFTNGQVQIGAGDFTFYVKNGFLIENGKLTQPIKDVNIIGNGPEALANITMTANNFLIDQGSWTCGKDGQSCPVSLGMPSALVSKLTVGGNN